MLTLGSCGCPHVMLGSVLDRECLYRWIAVEQRTHLRRDFLENVIVIIFDVSAVVPESGGGIVPGIGVERFDIFDESRLRFDPCAAATSGNLTPNSVASIC